MPITHIEGKGRTVQVIHHDQHQSCQQDAEHSMTFIHAFHGTSSQSSVGQAEKRAQANADQRADKGAGKPDPRMQAT